MAEPNPSKIVDKEKLAQRQKSGPSGATVKTEERENKFDEEGGDQPQAASQREAEEALEKSKPTGSEHDDRDQVPVGGQHNQQNPQLKSRK